MILTKKIAQNLWSSVQATRMGLEPTTSAVTGRRSNQLSHRAILKVSYLQNRTSNFIIRNIFFTWKKVPLGTFFSSSFMNFWLSPRPISKCQLSTLLHLHLIPIYLVVFKGSYLLGYLILRGASRLDAFSVYPVRTWLPCHGSGKPTGTPAVRPSRSSRTKDSSSQISYACAG